MIFIASLLIYGMSIVVGALVMDIFALRKSTFNRPSYFRRFSFIATAIILALLFFIPAGGFLPLVAVGMVGFLLGTYGRKLGVFSINRLK